jgi:hypothetical protein
MAGTKVTYSTEGTASGKADHRAEGTLKNCVAVIKVAPSREESPSEEDPSEESLPEEVLSEEEEEGRLQGWGEAVFAAAGGEGKNQFIVSSS